MVIVTVQTCHNNHIINNKNEKGSENNRFLLTSEVDQLIVFYKN